MNHERAHAAIGATDVGPVDVEDVGLGPVRLGASLFTLVDPHPGHEVAYNRWYERDHLMAGCTIGPYCWAARRWVATRELKDRRHVAPGGLADDALRGSYLSLYWLLAGHVEDWNRWAFREFRWLHDNGRMFPHRDHVHTLLYEHDWVHYASADPVPASLALDHPFAGLVVVAGDADGAGGRDAFDAWARDQWLDRLQADGAVEMTLSFTGVPLQVEAQDVARNDGPGTRFLHLSFLRRAARGVGRRLRRRPAAGCGRRVRPRHLDVGVPADGGRHRPPHRRAVVTRSDVPSPGEVRRTRGRDHRGRSPDDPSDAVRLRAWT